MEEWDESYSYYHYQRPERAGGGWITGGVFVDFVITCLFLFLIVYFTYNYVIQSYQRYRVFQMHPPVPASSGTSRLGPQSLPPLPDAPLSERRGGLGVGIDGAVGSKFSSDPEVQRLRRELEEKNAILTSMQRMAQLGQSSSSAQMLIPSYQQQQTQDVHQQQQQQQGHFFQGASFFGFGNGSPPRSAAARALFSQVFSQKQPADGLLHVNGMATPQYMAPQFAPSQADANPNPFLTQQPHQQVSAAPFPTNVSAPFPVSGGQPFFGNPQLNPAAAQPPPNPFVGTAPQNPAFAAGTTDAFGGSNINTAGILPNSKSNIGPFRGSVFPPSDGFVNGAQFRPTEQQNAALFSQHQSGGVAGFSQVGTGFTPQGRNTLFGTPQPQAGQLCPNNQINTVNNHNPNNNPFGQADLNRQFFSDNFIDQQTRPTELRAGDNNGVMGGEPHPRTHFSPVGVPTFGAGGATRRSGATGRTDSPTGRKFELPTDVNNKKGIAMTFDFTHRPPLGSQGRQMVGTQRLSDVAGHHPTMNHRTPVGRATGAAGVDSRLGY